MEHKWNTKERITKKRILVNEQIVPVKEMLSNIIIEASQEIDIKIEEECESYL